MSAIQSPLMSAAEFEDLIRRPRGTVKQWVCRHQMPLAYLKIRGKIMLRRETVEEWLNAEIPPYQKPPKSMAAATPAVYQKPPKSTAAAEAAPTAYQKPPKSMAAAGKRRGRPPKVADLARESEARYV